MYYTILWSRNCSITIWNGSWLFIRTLVYASCLLARAHITKYCSIIWIVKVFARSKCTVRMLNIVLSCHADGDMKTGSIRWFCGANLFCVCVCGWVSMYNIVSNQCVMWAKCSNVHARCNHNNDFTISNECTIINLCIELFRL